MKGLLPIVYCIIISFLLFSCNNTRNIPAGDALYTGAKVNITKSNASRKQRKTLEEDLTKLVRPKPNSKILGMRLKLSFYNMGGKKGKGLGKFFRKLGEPPVLLSQFDLDYNTRLLQNYLQNRGFFKAQVRGDTIVKHKKAHSSFKIEPGDQYKINNVQFPLDSSVLALAVSGTQKNTLLKSKAPYNLDLIKAERDRIDGVLKQRGYYYFSPDYLLIDADSSIGGNKVNLYVTVKANTPAAAREPYFIKDVVVYSNYNLNTASVDTTTADREFYKGYYVVDKTKMYKPKIFEKIMIFKPGEVYNRRDHNLALNRLINLGVYKFVKNRFEVVKDTNQLNAYYYLTPLPVHNISAEITGSSKSNNMVGSLLTFRWTDKNIGRRADILSIHTSVGTEVQYSGVKNGYNTYRLAGGFNFQVPRFVIPFFSLNSYGPYVPKTHIFFEYSILDRRKLYTLNSFSGELGYIWKPKTRKEHRLNPFAVTFVQPLHVSQAYKDSIADIPTLKKAIERQFIIGPNYNYTYDEYAEKPKTSSGTFFNGNLDLSGNILGLLQGANYKKGNIKEIFGVPYSQYVRGEGDLRRYIRVGIKSIWANRIDVGIGVPYGNSIDLPFVKQFFVGGNNSIRAFRSRSLGPGTYRDPKADSANFLPDQSGDIKLEMNTELRIKLSNIFEPAVFIDAGNVWLMNDVPQAPEKPYRPGGKFTSKFLNELAVGAGVGLRFDFQILLLRLDVAVPLRKPWLPEGHRWVWNQVNFGSSAWRKDNLIFNLAIGYPF